MACSLLLAFLVGEVIAGLVVSSLALLADAGHMLTDVAALLLALAAAQVARRPARGAFTYGYARVDALSGQANGITLVVLAVWIGVEGVRRLSDPAPTRGGVVALVAVVGVAVNLAATLIVARADRNSLSVRGALAHLMTDAWAFAATLAAGLVVVLTGWTQADALASLAVCLLMIWTGVRLVRAANRVFLEAAPVGIEPADVGARLAATRGVTQVHDLHVWVLGSSDAALSAHVLVDRSSDCHDVAGRLRHLLAEQYGINHVTLQVDHAADRRHEAESCLEAHGDVHVSPTQG